MRFSPHTEDWKLTLVQISERCRLTRHERDQWKMTPPSWPVSWVRKSVRRTELTLSHSSVYFGWWFKIIFFVAYMGVILSLNWKLFQFSQRCSVSQDCFAPSYRSCFVAVTVFTTGSVFTFPWSPCFWLFSRCAGIQNYLFFSRAKRYSTSLTLQGVCYCIQNYFCHWLSHFEPFSIYFSRRFLRCELFCHLTAIQHYFCC